MSIGAWRWTGSTRISASLQARSVLPFSVIGHQNYGRKCKFNQDLIVFFKERNYSMQTYLIFYLRIVSSIFAIFVRGWSSWPSWKFTTQPNLNFDFGLKALILEISISYIYHSWVFSYLHKHFCIEYNKVNFVSIPFVTSHNNGICTLAYNLWLYQY